jgi:hypothetical protein
MDAAMGIGPRLDFGPFQAPSARLRIISPKSGFIAFGHWLWRVSSGRPFKLPTKVVKKINKRKISLGTAVEVWHM